MAVRSMPKLPPLSVSHYELTGKASTGIPGVYRARDTETDTLVAVHLFPDTGAKSPRLIDRLSAEYEVLGPLEHPNILRVLEFGQESDFGYFVTEWVDGTTVAKMIESHARLPEGNVIRILAQVAQGMDYTRNGDAAPCRVNPEGILIRTDGVAKVVPFASAESRTPGPALSVPSVLKPEFAAAIQNAANSTTVPFAELIFSLGTTLHHALTGLEWVPPRPPALPPPGSRRRRQHSQPRLVGLTERTERAIRRATDPDPTKRPTSCAEFLKILRSRPLASGTPKPDARPTTEAGDNRRAFVRYALGVGTNCTINRSLFDSPETAPPTSQEIWPLVVQDVSLTGIGILLARRCESGTELLIEVGMGPKARSLPVRVVRVRKDSLGHWMHGCCFFTPLEESELTALLSQLGRPDPA